MEEYVVEQEEFGPYTAKIVLDEYPEDPREWADHFGTMVCFHNNYLLGDKTQYKSEWFESWKELANELIKEEDAAVILPLYLYDHSGITMSTGRFNCPWDSGQVGFIFVTREQVQKEYSCKNMTKKVIAKATALLEAEVEEYDQYLTGQVFGFQVEVGGEVLDSCYGFYGQEYCMSEARGVIKEYQEKDMEIHYNEVNDGQLYQENNHV